MTSELVGDVTESVIAAWDGDMEPTPGWRARIIELGHNIYGRLGASVPHRWSHTDGSKS